MKTGNNPTDKRIVITAYMKMYKVEGVEGVDTLYTGETFSIGDIISFRDIGDFVVEGRRFYNPLEGMTPVDSAIMQNHRIVFKDQITCSTLILKEC